MDDCATCQHEPMSIGKEPCRRCPVSKKGKPGYEPKYTKPNDCHSCRFEFIKLPNNPCSRCINTLGHQYYEPNMASTIVAGIAQAAAGIVADRAHIICPKCGHHNARETVRESGEEMVRVCDSCGLHIAYLASTGRIVIQNIVKCEHCGVEHIDTGLPHACAPGFKFQLIDDAPKTSDGSTASYYELPAGATELQDLIAYRDMNAQMGEIFRACYRYGQVAHSPRERDLKKIIFYAQAELDRLEKYGKTADIFHDAEGRN